VGEAVVVQNRNPWQLLRLASPFLSQLNQEGATLRQRYSSSRRAAVSAHGAEGTLFLALNWTLTGACSGVLD